MRTRILVCLSLTSVLLWNCSSQSDKKGNITEKSSAHQENGSILLKLDKAGHYSDKVNPSNNTAEWNVDISKAGRYKVWLSSATRDTIDLSYKNKVRVNLPDCQLVGIPKSDKVIQKSDDVSYPYYRADSYMGSVYFSEPGQYNIQVVSEMVVSRSSDDHSASLSDKTKLMGIILTPAIR
jgi:hypothetical protein